MKCMDALGGMCPAHLGERGGVISVQGHGCSEALHLFIVLCKKAGRSLPGLCWMKPASIMLMGTARLWEENTNFAHSWIRKKEWLVFPTEHTKIETVQAAKTVRITRAKPLVHSVPQKLSTAKKGKMNGGRANK